MALRDQPYLPLYVQDFLTDEKLAECSAQSTGVYIRIMCLMHKSEHYGKILLKQKHKQTDKQTLNFASQLAIHFPYSVDIINSALIELTEEGVLTIEDDFLIQKRMVRDNEISIKRALSGKKGGEKSLGKDSNFAQAKLQANTENENEYEYDNEIKIDSIDIKDKSIKKEAKIKKRFSPPALSEVKEFFSLKGISSEDLDYYASRFVNFYDSKNWFVGKNKMTNWKSAATRSLDWEDKRDSSAKQFSKSRGTSLSELNRIGKELKEQIFLKQ